MGSMSWKTEYLDCILPAELTFRLINEHRWLVLNIQIWPYSSTMVSVISCSGGNYEKNAGVNLQKVNMLLYRQFPILYRHFYENGINVRC